MRIPQISRELAITITFAVATLLFASFTFYLLVKPEPTVTWSYEGAYENSLLFKSDRGYVAYDVYTHQTISAQTYRGILDAVKEASK